MDIKNCLEDIKFSKFYHVDKRVKILFLCPQTGSPVNIKKTFFKNVRCKECGYYTTKNDCHYLAKEVLYLAPNFLGLLTFQKNHFL